jgi:two-component system, OmpR family, response regulator
VNSNEAKRADPISTALRSGDYHVTVAKNSNTASQKATRASCDLVTPDAIPPHIDDGFQLTIRLTGDGIDVPLLLLTTDVPRGYPLIGLRGRDDSDVTRPFAPKEIVPREEAILGSGAAPPHGTRLGFSDVVMDEASYQVWRAGIPIHLSPTEFNLLRLFLNNPRRALTKHEINEHVWHLDADQKPNLLPTYINYIRKKLDALGPPVIHTVRRVGYVLRESN